MNTRPNIALVYGAWAYGSSWSAVIERLQASGDDTVTAPEFPMTALADDVAGGLGLALGQRSAASAERSEHPLGRLDIP